MARDERYRIEMTVRCGDCESIPKVDRAGEIVVENGASVQIMHNGLRVSAGGYHGPWMSEIISRLKGHHEPQEELVFHEILKRVTSEAVMLELGGFWSYYSMWFLQGMKGRRAFVIEPDPNNLLVGESNARLNGCPIQFQQACVGRTSESSHPFATETSGVIDIPRIAVPDFLHWHQIDHLHVLHCDAQGAEIDVVSSCEDLFRQGGISFLLLSTHSRQITADPLTHQRCLAMIREFGGNVFAEYDVHESFSGDGLIAAYFGKETISLPKLDLSYNRYSTSLFQNPIYELAQKLQEPPPAEPELVTTQPQVTLDSFKASLDPNLRILRECLHVAGFIISPAQESVFFLKDDRDNPIDLHIGCDNVMTPGTLLSYSWQSEIVQFTKMACAAQSSICLVDVGANCGLYSRQCLSEVSGIKSLFAYEPHPRNFKSLQRNLAGIARVKCNQIGLSDATGSMDFHLDPENTGNYSLSVVAMPSSYTTIRVEIVGVRHEANKWADEGLPIFYKSDTQGFDEKIAAALDLDFWENVVGGIFELWRIDKPPYDMDRFVKIVESFDCRVFANNPKAQVSTTEVIDYLQANDRQHTDLLFWRSNFLYKAAPHRYTFDPTADSTAPMQSGTKYPLLIFGTPLGDWYPLARSIINAANRTSEYPYESWHLDLFGVSASELEVGLARKDSTRLELSESFESKLAGLASDGAANVELADVSVFGCWTADAWLKAFPSATCVVFYEDPALMISRYLAADPTGSPEALLSLWCASAQKIISAVRHHRDRVYLLNAEECLSYGDEYAQWAQRHLGVNPGSDAGASEAVKLDAALYTLAEALCSESLSIKKIVQELHASTQPVCDKWQVSGPGRAASSSAIALSELLALRQRNGGSAAEGREIERYREVAQKKEEEAAVAVKELLATQQRHGEIEVKDREIEQYKELVLRNQRETLNTHELLFTELHDAFKESEHHFVMWKKAEFSGGELSLKVDSVGRNESMERSEHRHINYTFRGVALFGRHWPTVHLRLVQHGGHAGIAVFSADPLTPPLYHWVPSGSENSTPFMLFVPSDAPARDALVRATTSDLVLIRDSVALIHADLYLHGRPPRSRVDWTHVAERLLQEIEELPERLHYDSVRTEPPLSGGGEPLFVFDVINAGFRGRIFSSLKVSWGPSLGGGRFRISLTDRAHPPLSYWPQGDDGAYVQDFEVRRYWNKFTRADKAFLEIILSEIPNFLVHAAHEHSTSSVHWKGLRLMARMAGAAQPTLWENFPPKPASMTSG